MNAACDASMDEAVCAEQHLDDVGPHRQPLLVRAGGVPEEPTAAPHPLLFVKGAAQVRSLPTSAYLSLGTASGLEAGASDAARRGSSADTLGAAPQFASPAAAATAVASAGPAVSSATQHVSFVTQDGLLARADALVAAAEARASAALALQAIAEASTAAAARDAVDAGGAMQQRLRDARSRAVAVGSLLSAHGI